MSERSDHPVGTIIDGRYRIRRFVGRGGMGCVYEVFDEVGCQALALKTIAPEWVDDPQMSDRFVDEAILTSRLNHPRIVNVHDIGHGSRGAYLTMELLRGRTLRSEMNARKRAGRTFLLSEVRRIIEQLSEALSYAHLYTVHRDLKPENIWLEADGSLKLMDFGLATVRSDQSRAISARTRTGVSFGTPYYIAPEQLQDSREVTPAADQYSVAAVGFELLTGEVPAGLPKSVSQLRPDVPAAVGRVISRGLAREPKRRFPSMVAFQEAFCQSQAWHKRLASSPGIFAMVVTASFLVGAVFVSVVEQGLSLREQLREDQVGSIANSEANQVVLSNRWFRMKDHHNRLGRDLRLLAEESTKATSIRTVSKLINESKAFLDDGALDEAEEGYSRVEAELRWALGALAHECEAKLKTTRNRWEELLNSDSEVLHPDLRHLADPIAAEEKGQAALARGDLVAAVNQLRRADDIYTGWVREVEELRARTFGCLSALAVAPTLFTNSIGMVFVKLPKPRPTMNDTWVSIWETRVLDYARFVADGGSWESQYHSDERWRDVSSREGPTVPVTGVSFSEAFRFCQWLGQRHSRHDPDAPKNMIPLLMTQQVSELIRGGLARWDGGEKEAITGLPEGVYAFSRAWPPLWGEPRFTGDAMIAIEDHLRPVASQSPNRLGLFDLAGNAWEWGVTELRTLMPHWYDSSPHAKILAGGGDFGCVTISDNANGLYTGWPGVAGLPKVGRIEAIGFRVVLVRWPGPKTVEELILRLPIPEE